MYLDPTPWEVNQSTLETLASISDEFTNDPSPAGIRSTFQQETLSVVKNNSFMGLWQLFAAAQIFRCCLVSIYPDLGWSALRDIHNRTITPPSAVTNRPPIHLMWSSDREDLTEEHWTANHILPLRTPTVPTSPSPSSQSQLPPEDDLNTAFIEDTDDAVPSVGCFYSVRWRDWKQYIAQVEDIDEESRMVLLNFLCKTTQTALYY